VLLQNKNAVIYGAGGSLGGAVAKALAAAGARVFLTGHHLDVVQIVADEIIASGHKAGADVVDALDKNAVETHLARVIQTAGSIDISFNAIGLNPVQNIPLIEMDAEDFVRPVSIAMRSHFLTATAAGRAMVKQRSGLILLLTATPGGIGYPYTAGFAPACSAMETLSRNLAAELGIHSVRVVNIRSAGSPDSKVFKDAIAANPEAMKHILHGMEHDTMLKKLPLMADIANVAVFLASDMAGMITGVTVDVTCGTTAGLNYRVMR
jgi:NAD(P)-dependent dehydrogenase (short-subunit alcohol dehydrogenase family)